MVFTGHQVLVASVGRMGVGDMLNLKARQIFQFISRYNRERGYPPSVRDIGDEFRIASTNGVRYYLSILERDGYIKRNPRISRGIEVTESGLRRFSRLYGIEGKGGQEIEWSGIPILGRVAAGSPLVAEQNWEGKLDLEDAFPSRDPRFALRVRGDSMKDAGILDGDLVVVRKVDHAENGDVVVALLGDDATVKRLEKRADRVVLQPANESHSPIPVRPEDGFRVLGVVIGLVRPSVAGGRLSRAR
jgi:repressor LexA